MPQSRTSTTPCGVRVDPAVVSQPGCYLCGGATTEWVFKEVMAPDIEFTACMDVGCGKSLRDDQNLGIAVLADSRSGNFPLFSRLIPCVKPTNIFTLGWIQHLESARCHRGAAKFSYQVYPDIRPRR